MGCGGFRFILLFWFVSRRFNFSLLHVSVGSVCPPPQFIRSSLAPLPLCLSSRFLHPTFVSLFFDQSLLLFVWLLMNNRTEMSGNKSNVSAFGKAAFGAAVVSGLTWLAVKKYRSGATATAVTTKASAALSDSKITITVTAPQPVTTSSTPVAAAPGTPASGGDTKQSSSDIPYDKYYFGYGSNMSSRTLNRRNIHPASSVPAVLNGYRLAMNLKSAMAPLEPTFANVEKDSSVGAAVHGVLHRVTQPNIEQLTREEGGGRSYQRMELPVVPYGGGPAIMASVFVLPDHRNDLRTEGGDVPCSARYKGLLVHGARESGIAAEYLARLEALPTATMPELSKVMTSELKSVIASREITLEQLTNKSSGYLWTSVKGVVIDITDNKTFLTNVFGGMEKTLDMAKFLCDEECPIPTSLAQLNKRHKAYIDAVLANLLMQHKPIGHIKDQTYDW